MSGKNQDFDLSLYLPRAIELAAIEAAAYLGKGDKNAADQAATDGLLAILNTVKFRGQIVSGEGEWDESPGLHLGNVVGCGGPDDPAFDIAVDPIDGTSNLARGGEGESISVIAAAPAGCLFKTPDRFYMEKIAVGPRAAGCIDLNAPLEENAINVAQKLSKRLDHLTVGMLERDRHTGYVERLRKLGCRVKQVSAGDIMLALRTALPGGSVDMMVGSGGSPEGVITAVAMKCLGGDFQCQFLPVSDEDRQLCITLGIDYQRVYKMEEICQGDVAYFAFTSITGGYLPGVDFEAEEIAITNTICARLPTKTVRTFRAVHNLPAKNAHLAKKAQANHVQTVISK